MERVDEASLIVREDRRGGSVLLAVDSTTGSVLNRNVASDRPVQPPEDPLAAVEFPALLSGRKFRSINPESLWRSNGLWTGLPVRLNSLNTAPLS